MTNRQIYAVYRNDENLADGTAEELAKKLGVTVRTIRKLASPSHHQGNKGHRLVVVRLGREEINNDK